MSRRARVSSPPGLADRILGASVESLLDLIRLHYGPAGESPNEDSADYNDMHVGVRND